MTITSPREIAAFLRRIHATGIVLDIVGEPFPLVQEPAATDVIPDAEEQGVPRDEEAAFSEHLNTLTSASANRVRRAHAAREMAAYVARHEAVAHEGQRLQNSIDQTRQGEARLVGSRAQLDERIHDRLRQMYRDPMRASRQLQALLTVAPNRLEFTRDLAELPEMLGELKGSIWARSARSEAKAGAKDLAMLVDEHADATAKLADVREVLGEVLARAQSPEGAAAQAAHRRMMQLGELLGAAALPSPLLFLTMASELAVEATPADLIGAGDLPPRFLADVSEQMVRAGEIRTLEEATPEGSALAATDRRKLPAKAPGHATDHPQRAGTLRPHLTPIERFKLAAQAVQRNEAAATRLERSGDVVAAHTAARWSARASAHLLDAAIALRSDHESLQAAQREGLLPQVDTVLEDAHKVDARAATELGLDIELDRGQ